jgi:hypothetical protein
VLDSTADAEKDIGGEVGVDSVESDRVDAAGDVVSSSVQAQSVKAAMMGNRIRKLFERVSMG